MDFNATIDLIIRDLEEARKIIDDLKKYPGVPVLQVELAKSKCKSAGEVIALLKTLQNFVPEEEKSEKLPEEPVKNETPVKKIVIIENPEAEVPLPVTENTIPDQPVKKPAVQGMVADSFSNLSNSLHEQLGNLSNDDDVAETLKTRPITNLYEAIGVNDRFFFIREIFNGNKDDYNQAISKLDKAENLKDAIAVIMSYTGDNNENEAVTQLIDLVKRKLPSNE